MKRVVIVSAALLAASPLQYPVAQDFYDCMERYVYPLIDVEDPAFLALSDEEFVDWSERRGQRIRAATDKCQKIDIVSRCEAMSLSGPECGGVTPRYAPETDPYQLATPAQRRVGLFAF